jgi:hypothetical protein
MAGVLQLQGKYEAAEEMNRRALEGREKSLGAEHPDTLTSVILRISPMECLQSLSLVHPRPNLHSAYGRSNRPYTVVERREAYPPILR